MVLKHKFQKLAQGRKIIPKRLWDILVDLDQRINDAVNNIESLDLSELLETVEVNINTTNSNGSSSANPELIGSTVIGVVPNGNQDQFIKEITVDEEGKVTVSLLGNATAQNKFIVSLLKG